MLTISRSIMKTTLLMCFHVIVTKAMYASSNSNFLLPTIEKIALPLNETNSNIDEDISIFSAANNEVESTENSPILTRKARQADSSATQTKEIDRIRIAFEKENNSRADPNKLIELINSLEKQVIDQPAPHLLQLQAQTLNNEMKNLLKDVLTRKLKNAVYNVERYKDISELCDKIYSSQSTLFGEVINRVTRENFSGMMPIQLIKSYQSHTYIGQTILGLSAVFNELRSSVRSIDGQTIVHIAFSLKNLMTMPNYPNVRQEARTIADNLKYAFPASVRNLAFASRVCLKNIARNEYLYAAGDGYKSDASRRRVLTWVAGITVTQGDWVIEHVDYVYYIKNFVHNEYLYAAGNGIAYDESRRNVYTWIPGNRVTEGRWIFEPSGDNVYIRNYGYTEYLLADAERKLDSGRRHVFTWRHRNTKTSDSLWAVIDCS